MSGPRPRKPRPLGSLRKFNISKNIEVLPTIPKLLPEITPDSDRLGEGILGNAMTVPPPSQPMTSRSRPNTDDRPKSDKKSPKSASSASEVSHDKCEKEIKDGLEREKLLKDQVTSLQKQIAELKIALRGSEEEKQTLLSKLDTQEKNYNIQLEGERTEHEATCTSLSEAREEVTQAQETINQMRTDHEAALRALREELEQKLAETVASKDAEIADKDQKLARLKSQMADALKGNSWERQQQLEELTKELARLQEESEGLRMKIKAISKNKQSSASCGNCDENLQKVARLQAMLKERDATLRDLKALCTKFETQLTTQDKLLEQWALSHGKKIPAPK